MRDVAEGFLAALAAPDHRPIADLNIVVVVAHPDDESIGFGGQLSRLRNSRVILVTDGAPRDERDARAHGFARWQDYAAARRVEVEAALAEAGIGSDRIARLDVADKEAAFQLIAIARLLAKLLRAYRADIVVTHPYEGGHPDHDATAFGVHAAAELLVRNRDRPPAIVEMASYHRRGDALVTQRFVPEIGRPETSIQLDPEALAIKRRMLAAHRTQARVLEAFTASEERLRPAPVYDFCKPANGGAVDYARITSAVTAASWCRLAEEALAELALR